MVKFPTYLAMSAGRFVFAVFPSHLSQLGLVPPTNGGGSPRRREDLKKSHFFLGSLKPMSQIGQNYLVGGFNPSEKYARQNGNLPQIEA